MSRSVAVTYAKAFYEVAKESSEQEKTDQDLKSFCEMVTSSDTLLKVFKAPIFSTGEKVRLVRDLATKLSLSPLSQKMLEILAEKNRISFVREIADLYNKHLKTDAGIVNGILISAVALDAKEVDDLKSTIENKISKKVELKSLVNKDLLGGFVVNVDGKTFDASVRSRLNKLQQILN